MRVAVVGAGGIGGFIAAALARAGHHVAVVARGPHLDAIRRHGIAVGASDLGAFQARVEAAADVRQLEPVDAVLLTFKAHQWPQLWPQLAPLAGTDTTIVTLQNGLPFWFVRRPPLTSVDPGGLIASAFPDERVVAGVVHVSGRVERPGHIVQSGGLRYVLGSPDGRPGERAAAVADVFRSAELAPELDPHVRTTVWLKLVNNAGLNPVSALRRLTIKPMLADAQARREVKALMSEALAVGRALGVVSDVDIEARIAYAARLDDVKTSMLQDVEAGRPLEAGPILGAIAELAQRLRIDVPHVRDAYVKLRELESGAARD